jgi:SAM-dependent methyltransferase
MSCLKKIILIFLFLAMFKKYKIEYELDDPRTTIEHKRIILSKPFLKNIYLGWYNQLIEIAKKNNSGIHLEIGSGGGFLKDNFPEVITSDILPLPGVDRILNAEELPFDDNSVSSIMMVNVFHHIPRPDLFLKQAQRTLLPGGHIIMIEPANTFFARFIYKNFHHEPFDPNGSRQIKPGNPLSNSNQALPFIYFIRDAELFKQEFDKLSVLKIKYHTPLLYLLSGGVSRSALFPDFTYGFFRWIENVISPFNSKIGLFNTIVIQKK